MLAENVSGEVSATVHCIKLTVENVIEARGLISCALFEITIYRPGEPG